MQRDANRHDTTIGEAPGRVNLIGEHTDYNGGFVLPTTIPQRTRVEMRARSNGTARIFSENMSRDTNVFEYEIGRERRVAQWIDYLQGVTRILAQTGFTVSGFDMRV